MHINLIFVTVNAVLFTSPHPIFFSGLKMYVHDLLIKYIYIKSGALHPGDMLLVKLVQYDMKAKEQR